jgi:F-type H+-transporting ATPase subunit b
MVDFFTRLALSEVPGESEGLFESLGIDWKILGLQLIAFVILVTILAKFIYPQISAMLDRRDKLINDTIKAAKDHEKKAAEAEKAAKEAMVKARQEAEDIVEIARKESADMVVTAEFDAKKKAEGIVRAAQAEIDENLEIARQQLRNEASGLVANATEKVAGLKLAGDDEKMVSEALEGKSHGRQN